MIPLNHQQNTYPHKNLTNSHKKPKQFPKMDQAHPRDAQLIPKQFPTNSQDWAAPPSKTQ